ncbi:FAD-binding oxidoreductase [Sulfuriflexus mobilis]|uniref:FAD-binding oxidoreductase n=1 Tax=Sulfuriflexus mobilis TaxID=1811807 RepID=UPI0018D53E86|nr:FAD-binding oxidoreductase [Sulfuriflexus mobilis]
MPEIIYQGKAYPCQPDETVLDTLRRNGIEVPYSCCAGACHTCMLHCLKGEVSERSQKDLKPALKNLKYFLACQCVPEQDVEVALPDDEDVYVSARLVEKEQLSPTVWRFRLEAAVPIYYHAGQFLNLKNEAGWVRSYSLASLPNEDEFLELHVRRMPDGQMSHWLIDHFSVGMHIEIEGPNGHCLYTDGEPERPLIMVGTGTGLAPLVGILRDALHQGHRGPIHLYHGVRTHDELYLHESLLAMAQQHNNVYYHACVSGDEPAEGLQAGRAADIALGEHPDLKGWRVFLCGAPEMVQQTRKKAFLAGASMQDISADAFTTPEH